MAIEEKELRGLIKTNVAMSIEAFFKNKEVTVTHVLDTIFPKERRIRSLIGGLETSIGTTVWEPMARLFAEQNDFEILPVESLKESVPVIPEELSHFIKSFSDRKEADMTLTHQDYFDELKGFIKENKIEPSKYKKMPKGEGVDVWLKKDGCEYLIDIKTTQINAGGGPKFSNNMLNWYAYRALEGAADVRCYLAFPFNPHKTDFWNKEKGKVSPLIPSEEAVVGDEFWDMLLGKEQSTKLIVDAFKELGAENFGEKFADIFEVPEEKVAAS